MARRKGPTAGLYAAADEQADFSDKDELGARTAAWMVEGIEAERELGAISEGPGKSEPPLPGMYERAHESEPVRGPNVKLYVVMVASAIVTGLVIALLMAR